MRKKTAAPSALDPQPWRLRLHTLSPTQALPESLRQEFSAMKYGCPTATDALAQALATLLLADARLAGLVMQAGTLWLAASAHGAVPTAAASLTDAVQPLLEAAGWPVRRFHIARRGGFERMDFGALGVAARGRAMRRRSIALEDGVGATLRDAAVLVIDDLRCTGTHEHAIAELLAREAAPRQVVFGYLVGFEGDIPADEEERVNHAKVSGLADLLPILQAGPRWNARLVKSILRHSAAELAGFWEEMGQHACGELHALALLADGYFDMARFRAGFQGLEAHLHATGQGRRLSYGVRAARDGKVVLHHLREAADGGFLDAEHGSSLDRAIADYSRFKFGDVEAGKAFAIQLADAMIAALAAGGSLRDMFERAGKMGEFVSLTAPGVRNVVSASNMLARETGMRVNAWLTLQGLPTMVIRMLGRLSSGRANYAELSARQRRSRDKTTQTLIPRSEYAEFPSHVVFLDDVEVSGETCARARRKSLEAGALSFHAAFLFQVDPSQAATDAGIEHRMNGRVVDGSLSPAVAAVLAHPDYEPVQRMLRLLLHPRNADALAEFLEASVGDVVLERLYLGALGNDYLWIQAPEEGGEGLYAPSLRVLQAELHRRGLLDGRGLPISLR